MKRIVSLLLAVMLLISLAACGAPANEPETSTKSLEHIDMPDYGAPVNEPETSTDLPVAPELQETVVFTDPVLETMVRGVIGKPEGSITTADAVAVTRLDLGAEWEQYSSGWTPIKELGGLEYFTSLESLDLSDHAITDISPLAGLSKLTVLALGGNPIANIAPLAGLTNLTVLALPGTGVSNLSPLSGLTRIRHLYLAGCPASDYAPLDGIYANLEGRDFEILPPPTTLAELGFTFNDGDKLALYETSEYDIRLNHGEWGDPPQPDWQNCIRVVTGAETGYKNAVGFYPVHSAYVVWIFNVNTEENYTYVYDVAESSFGCERAVMEPIVREAFGDSDGEDILLTPVAFFDNTIHEALGIAIDTLYNMPFDENIVLASPYEKLGFEFLDYKGTYYYEGYGIELHIHKPEWDKDVEDGHALDWSISFVEPNVKGYRTEILYFEDTNMYIISMEKDGAKAAFNYYPVEDKYEYNPNDIDPLRAALTEALGDDFMNVPMDIFKANVQELFGMSIDELYALPKQ